LQQEKVEEKNKTNKDSGNAFRCLTATSAIYVGGFGCFSNTACHLSLKHTKNKINKAKPISALLLSWYLHQSYHSKVSTSAGDGIVWFPNPPVGRGPCLVKD